MKYLITGGAGFIGSNYIHYLLKMYDDIEIINIDSLTYAGDLNNLNNVLKLIKANQKYNFIKADISCDHEIEEIFMEYKPNVVVNFAAESHVDRSIRNPKVFIETNVYGTNVLLEKSLKYGVQRFHQVSTDEVYGSLMEDGFFYEDSPLDPSSPYSASKASADLICQAYYKTFKLPITISRCSNNYGPNQHKEKLIPLTIEKLLLGQDIPVYGDGANIRDWLHVMDHCAAIDKIISFGRIGEIYNIGSNNEWENIKLILQIIKILNSYLKHYDKVVTEKQITFVKDRQGHDRRYAIDASKINKELNWRPKFDFKKGLEETVHWYMSEKFSNLVWK
ncbi:dTDP-glucose 4,6-dehydratase [Bacillus sp. M6-12]|uniref:dTDP-glucose 4,6-dehydratase n=1 Tax=Bacillus sp. M6-12 TaxID=2054166 RepID=UPI000C761A6C|nr:dTDP-glucose 4,6-dehydratase [Bacillus sp. M6-12]PLS17880.1 dTDP-glucose 4,6-dehydratase [Bacillus sp. M6-12]